jgi:hypothetical protein
MNHLTVNIFNKLNNIDVLYSLIRVNEKLDRLFRDITLTQSIDLVRISSNEHNHSKSKSIFNRFCIDILLRIEHNIECLTLYSLSIDHVLRIGNLGFGLNGDSLCSSRSLINFLSRRCYQSNIVYLNNCAS